MIYKIIAKYIKDLKFEIPNPSTFFLLSKNIANYKKEYNTNKELMSELINIINKNEFSFYFMA